MLLARKVGDKYGLKLMETETKTLKNLGIIAVEIASIRVLQKTAEVTGDVTENKIGDKVISAGKSKEYWKIINLIGITSETVPKFNTQD